MHRRHPYWLRFTTTEQDNGSGGGSDKPSEFTPITSQDDLNKVIAERVGRERKKFADYPQLKAKADELDKLKAANQTETDKLAGQITDLQSQLEASNRAALRARIQAKFSISDEDAELFLTGTDDDTLTRQAQALADRVKAQTKKGPVVPSQGNHPSKTGADDDMRDFTRQLFGRDDN